ncbi:MAG: Phosphoglucomutase-3 [Caeruleum heppii]|nr:MAG: Phosphoglucomutase-3 [Caeruleum heppii]
MTSVQDLTNDWLRFDRDQVTRRQIETLRDEEDWDELESLLRTRIAFGTAGLRARMEAGFSRLNALTIIQASQGLAAYILCSDPSAGSKGIVLGHDARHNSERFARLAATAFVKKGFRVWWYGPLVHTPMVPYGVKMLGAAAGVMVTASHNPAYDNGYKVYWSNACQIVSPHDSNIAASILQNLEPLTWDENLNLDPIGPIVDSLELVRESYFADVLKLCSGFVPHADIRFVYTPMHGVGLRYMTELATRLGIEENMVVVEEQANPDPDFPTVKFPNPEERGALDLAKATADRDDISLVIANDPDADRFAVAEKVNGEWHSFTGNEIGILLASHIISTYYTSSSPSPRKPLALLTTTVSTSLLSSMSQSPTHPFHYTETLTGFKNLGNAALRLQATHDVPYAFEEALGYMFTSVVPDKDAIAAGAVFLTACAQWWPRSPWQRLQEIYQELGYSATANTYLVSPSPAITDKVFARIRSSPSQTLSTSSPSPETPPVYPSHLGPRLITRWIDLTTGYDSSTRDHIPILPVSKESHMITFELADSHPQGYDTAGGEQGPRWKVTARTSGTEPKIKLYVECRASVAVDARRGADAVREDLIRGWFAPADFGLRREGE